MTVTVVLTAAVTPTVTHKVAQADPDQRARDYAANLVRWGASAEALGLRLVVVETTGAERSAFWPRGVEGRYLSFAADAADSARGKGAVEAEALDHALRHAPELREGTLFKCTGRLWADNLGDIVAELAPGTARVRRTLDWSWVDTRLFGAAVDVWRRSLTGMGPEVDEPAERYIEHVAAQRLRAAWATGTTTLERFPRRPRYVGVSGSTGIDYAGRRERVKGAVLEPLERLLAGPLGRKLI